MQANLSVLKGCVLSEHLTLLIDLVCLISPSTTKLPESGVLCGNVTESGVEEDPLSLQGEGDPPPQTK